jgi:osmotically-inducible protein OsmY
MIMADPGRWGRTDRRYDAAPYGFGAGYGREGSRGGGRDWLDRTQDEVASWFGAHGAQRRRQWDEIRGRHGGIGPRGYKRSEDRVREDVSDRLTDDPWLDASEIEVEVRGDEVTLNGHVSTRQDKRRAEDMALAVSGVAEVQNNLRVRSA